jgi:4-amino-4-deoxy-L-arabinose transferase-like glycosyltransferase
MLRKALKLSLFVIIPLLVFLCWVLIVPFNKAPDEVAHFGLESFMAQYGRLPVSGEAKLAALVGPYSVYYGALPPLPYILGSLGVALATAIGSLQPYLFARLVSAACGMGTVFVSYKLACAMFPKNKLLQVSVPLTVLLIPQASFIFSYVNNDAFTIFAISLFYYCTIDIVNQGWTLKKAIRLGVVLGLSLLSKPNGYIVGPLAMVLFLSEGKRLVKTIKYWLTAGISALLVSGWWFVRNYLLYNGDFLGIHTTSITTVPTSYHNKGFTLVGFLRHSPFVEWSFKSSLAVFDYMTVFLPKWYYSLMLILALLGLIGLILAICIGKNGPKHRNLIIFYFALAIILATALSIWSSYNNDFQAQGKYLYTAFLPFVILFSYGLHGLFELIMPKFKQYVFTLYCALLIGLNGFALLTLYRYYY